MSKRLEGGLPQSMNWCCEMLLNKQLSNSSFSCFRGIGNLIKLRGGGKLWILLVLPLNAFLAGGSELLSGLGGRVSMVRHTVLKSIPGAIMG